MVYKRDRSIPRIHVVRERDQIVCILDQKLQQRYGRGLLKNGKQGRHLFSISYCIASMAANYSYASEGTIVRDILSRFHLDFLTKLVINSTFSGPSTYFLTNWEFNFDEMVMEYRAFRAYQGGLLDLDVLQNYLNQVGAMLHVLPCNVAYSENASDPHGGGKASKAMAGIQEICRAYNAKMVNRNIALTLDGGVIQELFEGGFNDNNIQALSFIILQIWELQSLQNKERPSYLTSRQEKRQLEADLFDIVFKPHRTISRDRAFSNAFSTAIGRIDSARKQVERMLRLSDHRAVKKLIREGLDAVWV